MSIVSNHFPEAVDELNGRLTDEEFTALVKRNREKRKAQHPAESCPCPECQFNDAEEAKAQAEIDTAIEPKVAAVPSADVWLRDETQLDFVTQGNREAVEISINNHCGTVHLLRMTEAQACALWSSLAAWNVARCDQRAAEPFPERTSCILSPKATQQNGETRVETAWRTVRVENPHTPTAWRAASPSSRDGQEQILALVEKHAGSNYAGMIRAEANRAAVN